jgi:hypothetical protein
MYTAETTEAYTILVVIPWWKEDGWITLRLSSSAAAV